ncbi:MAG: PAS domain-containing protein [Campylobacterota bacterium]|nr:PAS domain-containing protein [Campylobacterota bacterium]
MGITPKNNEKKFKQNELLVTKTDLKGIITYANSAFVKIIGMNEEELIGEPHNVIRHPDMPKLIFKILWDALKSGHEVHAYIKNICTDGSYYWVMANVTPSYLNGKVVGYHSARRLPSKNALNIIEPFYKKLISAERNGGLNASQKVLDTLLQEKGVNYDEFILSI